MAKKSYVVLTEPHWLTGVIRKRPELAVRTDLTVLRTRANPSFVGGYALEFILKERPTAPGIVQV